MRITFLQLPYFLPLFLFFVSVFSLAQEAEFVRASVIDQSTGEPVVFASILLKGNARGVVTNLDGGFRLPARYREEGITIQISSMGYQKKEVPLIELSLTSLNTIGEYNRSNPWCFRAHRGCGKRQKEARTNSQTDHAKSPCEHSTKLPY